jgi:2-iminobutanoate/2-iminopropanoate deaminase
MRKNIHVEGLPDLRPYGLSQGVETDNFVFVPSMALERGELRRDHQAISVADETRIVLERMDEKLRAVGLSLADVVKSTCYLTDRNHFTEFAEEYKKHWDGDYPTRVTVYVGLAVDCRVEIDAVAVKPSAGGAK